MPAKLRPGELLDQLFQGANSAGQCHECIGLLEHDPFALMHVAGDDALLNAGEHVLTIHKEVGDHAGHRAAMIERGFGKCAHQAHGSSAIDKPDPILGQNPAEALCRIHEGRNVPGPGRTIDANGFDSAHADSVDGDPMWPRQGKPSR